MTSNRLQHYVSVAERVFDASREVQSVEISQPVMLTGKMGYIQATVTTKNGRKATGTASFVLDLGGNSAKATNPIEDCETSAVGRALAFLGYSSDKRQGYSIATQEEVVEAQRRADAKSNPQGNREKYVSKIEKMMQIGAQHKIDLAHANLDMPFDDLDDAELIELGRSLKDQLATHGLSI